MLYLQRLKSVGSNLIYKGQAHRFDMLGLYKGVVDLRFKDLEPVRVVSYLTQGNVAEVVNIDDDGNVLGRTTAPMNVVIDKLTSAKKEKDCLGVLIRNVIIEDAQATNYLVLYRK